MKNFIYILFIFLFSEANAQQEGQYLQINNNPFIINPAAGGLSNIAHFEASSRTQWLGYSGSPRSMMITGHSPISFKGDRTLGEFNAQGNTLFQGPTRTTGSIKHVIGGKALVDAIGVFNKSSVTASYAIHLPLVKDINFGAGIGLGWSNFRIDEERVTLHDIEDASYAQFLGNTTSQNILDANAGLVFYNERLLVSLSTTQVLKNNAVFGGVETNSRYNRHYFMMAKYAFEINNKLDLEPIVLVKMAENSPVSMDGGLRFVIDNRAWAGFHYRTSNAFAVQLGANLIKNFYLAYGYEIATGPISTSNNGSHEIQIGYYLGKNRNLDREIKENKENSSEE